MRNKKLIPFEIIEKAVAGMEFLNGYSFQYFHFLSLPFRQRMGRGSIEGRKGME